LLPYNLTVTQLEGGEIELNLVDPLPAINCEVYPELIPVVSTAYQALHRVADSLPGIV
jgi:hypothetical protein